MRLVPDDDSDEQRVRELLEEAGPRPAPPEEDVRAIASAARAVWEAKYASRRRPRRWILALAAALAITATLGWWIARRPGPVTEPTAIVARVEHVTGAAGRSAGETLPAGATVSTPDDARLALNIEGRSLRLDSATRIRLADASVIELQQGAVYLDSASSHAPLTIRTRTGDFTPAGTQFEVRLVEARTELRVREGVVHVGSGGLTMTAKAGEELIVGDDGTTARGTMAPDDARWNWAILAAPRFEIEGRSLRAFLEWTAREQGRTLRFASDDAAAASETTTLHGSVAHLDPDQALRAVLLSTGFDVRVEGGALVVSER